MSVLFTDFMTVYNHCRDETTGKDIWNRSVVKGIQWSHNKSELSTTNGVQTENRVERITVDFRRTYGNKPYLAPNEYRKLSPEEAAGYWTLDAKTGQDVLVLGETEIEINREYRIRELEKDFQYMGTVSAVSDNRNRPKLKNIKVVAR